jgi:hypothetical protein
VVGPGYSRGGYVEAAEANLRAILGTGEHWASLPHCSSTGFFSQVRYRYIPGHYQLNYLFWSGIMHIVLSKKTCLKRYFIFFGLVPVPIVNAFVIFFFFFAERG